MALSLVNMCGKVSGSIWNKKPAPDIRNGLVCEVTNTKPSLTSQGKRMHFCRVAFGVHGNWFVAGDHLGDLYHFDLNKNRFKLVVRGGHACTALCCCISRSSEVLLAMADYSIRCVDVETCVMVANLRGHEASVSSLSIHSSGRLVLAVSSRDCVLWDLECFTRHKTLNGGQEVGVQDVFFVPLTNTMLSCFKDDSIHAWDSTSLDYKYQIPPPFGPAPHYRAFAVPRDGHLLVAGGRSNFLHVWTLETRQLLRIIQLPAKVCVLKQLLFVPDSFDGGSSECLGFLAQDGIMRFIDIHSCKLLFQIGSPDQMLSSVQVCPTGNKLAVISEAGNIMVYDVSTLISAQHQCPVPVIRMQAETKPSKVLPPTSSRSMRSRAARLPTKVTSLVPRGKCVDADGGRGKRKEVKHSYLDKKKLVSVLRGFGEYPAKYRMFIWRTLLKLPGNHSAYSTLLERGTHPAYLSLHAHYPIKSRKLLRVLQRSLSVLAHWATIFGETDYLPGLVFPFVKMFQNNQLVTFEMLATILLNWCGEWFEYFPNPPFNILAVVENCLAHHDQRLLEHFIMCNISTQMYAWPLLSTLFSEILSKGEWLRMWDNVVSHHPGYLLLILVSYLTSNRHTLFKCSSTQDFEYFFGHQSSVNIGSVIQEANLFQQTTPPSLHPEKLLRPFEPLAKETYQIFNKYPKFIMDYQVQERERIRVEELDYLRERQSALEMERMVEQRKEEEETWYRQQQLLLEAEDQRRKMMEVEEKKLTDQRTRLQALKRELKVKELHVLDAARHRFLGHQQNLREAELKRLDQQVQKKVQLREKETQAVMEDVQTRTVELERQKALLEQELGHCQEKMRYRLRANAEVEERTADTEMKLLERALEEDEWREKERLDEAQCKLAHTQAVQGTEAIMHEVLARRNVRELQQTLEMEDVVEKAKLIRLQEQKLNLLMAGLEETKEVMVEPSNNTMGCVGSASWEGVGQDTTNTTTTTSMSIYDSKGGSQVSALGNSTHFPQDVGNSALQWCQRRDLLDQQEKTMMARVRELRQKVVGSMSSNNTSSTITSIVTPETSLTP